MRDHILFKSASLSKIVLSEKDIIEFLPQIKSVLEWEKTISKLVEKQKDSANPLMPQEKLFTFSYEEESHRNEITAHVKTEQGYFVVPKVIEETL